MSADGKYQYIINRVFGIGQFNGIFLYSHNYGQTWSSIPEVYALGGYSITCSQNGKYVAYATGTLPISSDYGVTFTGQIPNGFYVKLNKS
jgi:hypothetical protein